MENLLLMIIEAFTLNQDEKNFIHDIFDKINPTVKDEEIVSNLIKYRLDFNSVCAYFICEYNLFDLPNVKEDILKLAKNLQELESYSIGENKLEEAELLRKQFVAMCNDIRVMIIKLCLVLYETNLCTLPLSDKDKELLVTTRNIYAPLAERLGFGSLKSTLEDICLKNLDPEVFKELEANVLLKREENLKQIEITKNQFQKILDELGLKNATISARQKHFSSVYKKIQQKNVPLAKIYDLIAMRIIVDTVEECYAVLGKIHGIYRPMEGRFKDYISNPKPNGYQSLHTTVIVENDRPLEVQIRTYDMHRNSEFGVDVAHWVYKEKRKTTDLDKKLSWLREIMDESSNLNSDEFIETLKTNLYSGTIYVQTPKGKVLEFPEGATVLDFAYAIHSEIGNSCVGGKISGKMVPLGTKLANNDIVEILTSPTSKGPSRDWLTLVKTSGARGKINAFFRHELKEENIKNGRQIIELALKGKNLPVNRVLTDEVVHAVLQKYAFNTEDEMLAAVGYGSLSANQVVGKIIREYERINQTIEKEKSLNSIVIKKNKDGILVDGDSGMMVRYAGCCSPILGEDIVGYISRGRGVTIHKADCANLKYLEQERLIKAEWEDKNIEYKICNITVIALQDDKFIFNLTSTISNFHFNIVGLETKYSANNIICNLKVKINKLEDADRLVGVIKNIDKVLEVKR